MADARQFGTQELVSAKYLVDTEELPVVEQPARRAEPRRSGPEQTLRWLTPVVIVMLMTGGGGLYWLNRASIESAAGELNERRSVVDLLLWAGGSKQTFHGALSDRLEKAQRDSAYQFDEMKPAFETEFDDVDWQNFSPSWNGNP